MPVLPTMGTLHGMKIERIDALILSSEDAKKTADFYRSLGLDIVKEDHGDGDPVHYAADFAGVHFAIFPAEAGKAPEQRHGGSTKIGFRVDDVDSFYKKAVELGAHSKKAPVDAIWGRNAVVIDPDGRTLEFNG